MNHTIEPFTAQPLCRKCSPPAPNLEALMKARAAAAAAFGPLGPQLPEYGAVTPVRVSWCSGGKELEKRETSPLAEIIRSVSKGPQDLFASLTTTSINICAGIIEEHLHCTCLRCGHESLMATADATPKAEAN